MSKTSLLSGAALITLVALAGAAQASTDAPPEHTHHHRHHVARVEARKDDSAMIVNEMSALHAQLDQLRASEEAQAAAAAQTQAQLEQMRGQLVQAQTAAQAAQAQLAEQVQTIPGEIHQEVAAVAPKTDHIYYRGVTVTLGGFAAMETVFRSHNEGADIGSSFSAIPLPYVAAGHTAEERFSARQSRFSLLAQGDVSPTVHLAGYGEFDFLGSALTANSNESNSYTPRIRHFYSTVDWDQPFGGIEFLAGQTWSLLTLDAKGITPRTEVTPLTIDAQYVPGFTWTRQPQMRVVFNFDHQLWFGLSVENPQTTFYTSGKYLPGVSVVDTIAGGAEFPGSGTTYALSLNKFPDVIGKVALDENLAGHNVHAEAYGLLRDFYDRLTAAGVTGNEDTVGGGVGGALILGVIPHWLDFQASGLVGDGIGRYGSAQLPDVSFGVNGVLHPVHEYEVLLGAIGHVGSRLDVYLYGGEERQFAQDYNVSSTVYNGVGSTFLNNSGCETENSTACGNSTKFIDQLTTGFWERAYSGKFGRLQWGIQYSYTERHLFPGYGAAGPIPTDFNPAPAARENMILTSVRYYPF
jgi:hypothetical protein